MESMMTAKWLNWLETICGYDLSGAPKRLKGMDPKE
jgi:hypothetical protein